MSASPREGFEELLTGASITCGGIFAGYLGVRIGTVDASPLTYLNLISTFVFSIAVASFIHLSSRLLFRRAYKEAAGFGVFAAGSAGMLLHDASTVGIDVKVLSCVLIAWCIIPVMGYSLGRIGTHHD